MSATFLRDLRFGARALARRPRFTAIVVLILALGIGVNSAIFSIIDEVLLRSLPYEDPERLVVVWQTDERNGALRQRASIPDLVDWRRQSQGFAALAAFRSRNLTLSDPGGRPERAAAGEVSWQLFPLFGVQPALGRTFSAEEDQAGGDKVVVLGHDLWSRRFGADPNVIGKAMLIDGVRHEVIGVLPATFVSPVGSEECWLPLQADVEKASRGVHDVLVFGRLEEGSSPEQAQEAMALIMRRLEQLYPDDNTGRGAHVESLREAGVWNVRTPLLISFTAAALVLLIACGNVASLLAAQALERQRELAVRASLGASAGRLLGQVMSEALLLALLGGGAGLLLAHWGLEALPAVVKLGVLPLEEVAVNGKVLLFSLLLSLLTTGLCSLGSLLQAPKLDLQALVKEGGRSTAGLGHARLRRSMVLLEVALATVLVVLAGLLTKSLYELSRVDLGFESSDVLTLDVTLPPDRYPFPDWATTYPAWPEMDSFYRAALANVRRVSGVEQVALAVNGPLEAGWTSRVTIAGRPEPAPGEHEEVRIRPVSPGFFQAIGATLLRGRDFEEADGAASPFVVIVNEAFVRRHFDAEPLGEKVTVWGKQREIVGVVQDQRFMGPQSAAPPALYFPFLQAPFSGISLVVRTLLPSERVVPALKEAIWSIDPELAVYDVSTLEETLSGSLAQPRFDAFLFLMYAALAIALAIVGVYGLISSLVVQRKSEIGVRMALGASRSAVLRMVLRDGGGLLIAGIAAGMLLALWASRLIEGWLFDVPAADPTTFLVAATFLLATGMVALSLPALRAIRIDPAAALKAE